MTIKCRKYRVRFDYRTNADRRLPTIAWEYVTAPTRLLALWAAREQRHGCIIADPDCIKETIGIVRTGRTVEHSEAKALRKYEIRS